MFREFNIWLKWKWELILQTQLQQCGPQSRPTTILDYKSSIAAKGSSFRDHSLSLFVATCSRLSTSRSSPSSGLRGLSSCSPALFGQFFRYHFDLLPPLAIELYALPFLFGHFLPLQKTSSISHQFLVVSPTRQRRVLFSPTEAIIQIL